MSIDPSQALMIGDSMKNDIEGASAVGINTVLLDRSNDIDYKPKITNLLQLQQII